MFGQIQIKLQADTGAGHYPLVANIGVIPVLWISVVNTALNGQPIDDFDTLPAGDIVASLDRAIDSLQNQRNQYEGLQDTGGNLFGQYRTNVLDFFINWRNLCQQHPRSTVYLYGWFYPPAGL